MKQAQHSEGEATAPRLEFALTTLIIPLLSGVLMALGLVLLDRYRNGHTVLNADLAVALMAAVAGVLLAAWWFGGMLMLACAATARRLRWRRVEKFATHLTPRLIARTVGAVVGIHLVTVSAAQATEPVNPFWPGSESSVSQLDETESAASVTGPSDSASAQSPEATPKTDSEQDRSGPDRSGPHNAPALPALPTESWNSAAADSPDAATPPGSADATVPEDWAETTEVLPAPKRVTDSTVTVVWGDTLWDITAQFLGPHADQAQIAAQTATWMEHNDLQNCGHLIRPGDQLRVPPHLLEVHSSALPVEGATS